MINMLKISTNKQNKTGNDNIVNHKGYQYYETKIWTKVDEIIPY